MSFFVRHHLYLVLFQVLRCLIYKVHAPTAEQLIDYHIPPHLSTPFFRAARTFFTLDGGRKPACEEAFALANMPYLNTFLPPLQALFLLFPLFCRNRLITPPYIGYYCQKWQNQRGISLFV